MNIIRWEDPPPSGLHNPRDPHLIAHELIAVQLKREPGRWAVVIESTGNEPRLANHITSGHYRAYKPAGSFQAVSRTVNGIRTIYARFVGTQGES